MRAFMSRAGDGPFFLDVEMDGTLPTYADGGYPLIYCVADGGTLCAKCANAEGHMGIEAQAKRSVAGFVEVLSRVDGRRAWRKLFYTEKQAIAQVPPPLCCLNNDTGCFDAECCCTCRLCVDAWEGVEADAE